MAIRYVPYYPNTLEGQALLSNFTRTRRILSYRDNDAVFERVQRGMPLYETELQEEVGSNPAENMLIRGECVSACAYLKEQGIKVDLVYIDPPFASGADYAKKVYLRKNPRVAAAIEQAEEELGDDDFRAFEEKMYGDIWDKERYLNWMYENLMAIKSVMSETASIYVHLDWHIGHYVKILMDEIFGEENFKNEVVWYYRRWNIAGRSYAKNHDVLFWYTKDSADTHCYNQLYIPKSVKSSAQEKSWKSVIGEDGVRRSIQTDEPTKGVPMPDVWEISMINPVAEERSVGYATQKPVALLERIISASSKPGMIVADFFGGSGVSAVVAHKTGRRFIHADIGINSIQTTRKRLVEASASFSVREIQDGVSLYRNPVQTMDKLKSLIPGLRNEDALDKFWEGSIADTKYGMMPIYLPNLMDSTTRLLDRPLMNRILREAMPDLPADTKRVIVYYIDITDTAEIQQFIEEQNDTGIEVELRDLKQVLDNVVTEDEAEWDITQSQDNGETAWKVNILSFFSDRVKAKIDEHNAKGQQQHLNKLAKGKNSSFKPLTLTETGLEMIEWLSVDTTSADKNAAWHSESEIFIDRYGKVVENGTKTNNLWDGCISSVHKPLRLKIRNICGDESVFIL